MFLLRHFEIEPNNLGVVVKDDRCIATKIDGDEALQIAFHLHKTNFSGNTAHYFNYYNYIEASYHCVHRYKVSKDKSVISMGLWRENQMVKDVEFELKFNIDTIDDNLMEKLLHKPVIRIMCYLLMLTCLSLVINIPIVLMKKSITQ
ncbi:MAG: hypothetical protein AB8B46_00485 [Candidatus Midichloriaceae bacterium]